ncbi:hypothetical protein CC117_11935 [Parafrankia colletiae]|uniref:Methyltransferase type 11 domain-containing protein n=1 Tax=Parafrankia colletiae TaxID=573497 RepID=A0A1S1R7Y8_9ACTN|nr:hypothetical protein [Parafrankia colletiae]MCK9900769.1 hypothetical protein [Frankia sp. Cpl3]OHV42290.1 hypothetical protein CC117_11935 [Parafrankia colletiae]
MLVGPHRHLIADLPAAAAELRRVLAPSAPVLIRSPFPGRHGQTGLFRFFPEATRALDDYPTVERVRQVFTAAGFRYRTLETHPPGDRGLPGSNPRPVQS